MAMIRHRAAVGSTAPTRLLYSSRTPDEVIYFDELQQLQANNGGLKVFYTFTRAQPPGWTGYSRRIDARMLAEVSSPLGAAPQTYICGPTLLVEAVANEMVRTGVAASYIRTERFGQRGHENSECECGIR